MTHKLWRGVALSLLLVLAAAVSGYVYYQYSRNPPDNVLRLYGNVELRQVALAFNASERIRALWAEEGDWVRQGDLLGELDTRTLQVEIARCMARIEAQQAVLTRLENGSRPEEIAQAQAGVTAAEADVRRTGLLYEKYENVVKNTAGRGVARQDVDSARADYDKAQANLILAQKTLALAEIGPRHEDIDEARAQLAAIQAELRLLRRQEEESRLLAPVDAFVRSRLMEPGDMASPQRPVFTLALVHPKWVRAYLAENELGLVQKGMRAQVWTDSMPGKALTGQVGFISSNAEFTPKQVQTEALRTSLVYEVRIYVDDTDDRLKLGMPVTVTLIPAEQHEQ